MIQQAACSAPEAPHSSSVKYTLKCARSSGVRTRPRTGKRSASLPEFGRETPPSDPEQVQVKSITLDLTHDCPFSCRSCIEKEPMSASRHASLSLDAVCHIIERHAELGGTEVLFYGGEPTVYPPLPKVLKHAARHGQSVRMITNGARLLRPELRQAVAEATKRVDVQVRVSLNAGTEETHSLVHGCKGVLPRVLAGMAKLKTAAPSCQLVASYLVQEANASEIEGAYEIARGVGVDHFDLRPQTGSHGIGLLPLEEPTRRRILEHIRRIQERQKITESPSFQTPEWFIHYLTHGVVPDTSKNYQKCWYCAAVRLVVSPPGRVWACPYWRGVRRFLVADLRKVEFGSNEFERLRIEAIRRISPAMVCQNVICNRHEANETIWAHTVTASSESSSEKLHTVGT